MNETVVSSSRRDRVIATLGVLAAGLLVPGGGLAVAGSLIAFTRLGSEGRGFKVFLVVLGVALIVLDIGILSWAGSPDGGVGPITRAP